MEEKEGGGGEEKKGHKQEAEGKHSSLSHTSLHVLLVIHKPQLKSFHLCFLLIQHAIHFCLIVTGLLNSKVSLLVREDMVWRSIARG